MCSQGAGESSPPDIVSTSVVTWDVLSTVAAGEAPVPAPGEGSPGEQESRSPLLPGEPGTSFTPVEQSTPLLGAEGSDVGLGVFGGVSCVGVALGGGVVRLGSSSQATPGVPVDASP